MGQIVEEKEHVKTGELALYPFSLSLPFQASLSLQYMWSEGRAGARKTSNTD